jgi:hypothetical protein
LISADSRAVRRIILNAEPAHVQLDLLERLRVHLGSFAVSKSFRKVWFNLQQDFWPSNPQRLTTVVQAAGEEPDLNWPLLNRYMENDGLSIRYSAGVWQYAAKRLQMKQQ